jgi:hypothetical protein
VGIFLLIPAIYCAFIVGLLDGIDAKIDFLTHHEPWAIAKATAGYDAITDRGRSQWMAKALVIAVRQS